MEFAAKFHSTFLQSLWIVLSHSLLVLEEQINTGASEPDAEQAQRLIALCAQDTPCLPGCLCLMGLPCLGGSDTCIQVLTSVGHGEGHVS
jgi:hypothetical protein